MAPASPVELDPDEPLRVAARRVIAARAEDLAGIAPGAVGAVDPEALHDVRVAVRRLTSALDVFAVGLDEDARRSARRMLRRDDSFSSANCTWRTRWSMFVAEAFARIESGPGPGSFNPRARISDMPTHTSTYALGVGWRLVRGSSSSLEARNARCRCSSTATCSSTRKVDARPSDGTMRPRWNSRITAWRFASRGAIGR